MTLNLNDFVRFVKLDSRLFLILLEVGDLSDLGINTVYIRWGETMG